MRFRFGEFPRDRVVNWSTSICGKTPPIAWAGDGSKIAFVSDVYPDCPDEEQCREVPAPPGGIPYKQCIPR